MTKHK